MTRSRIPDEDIILIKGKKAYENLANSVASNLQIEDMHTYIVKCVILKLFL